MPSILSAIFFKRGKLFVAILWLASTLLYLKLFGVVTNLEAVKYIGEAEHFIKTGTLSAPRYWFYSVTIFILIISFKLKIGIIGAFIMQALLNLFAYLFFHKALRQVFKHEVTAFFVIAYLLLFLPYQYWVVFLYTESAFFSLILILFSMLVLYGPSYVPNGSETSRRIKNILLICFSVLLLIIARPLGILFAGSTYLYFLYCSNTKWKIILGACSVLMLLLGYFTVNAVFSSIKDWHITQAFEQESIICDMPVQNRYPRPELASGGTPVYQLWYYLSHNLSHFLHFAGVKMQYFFLMTRDYYSKGHNLFLLINTIVLYLLALTGLFIKKVKFKKGLTLFLLSSIALYALTIIFQCDDYHNRFALSIFPFFVVLAAGTVEYAVLSFLKHNK